MGQRRSEPSISDSIDEFFEPVLGDMLEGEDATDEPHINSRSRLAELRRRAEARLEEKRMRDELNYIDLDWDDD